MRTKQRGFAFGITEKLIAIGVIVALLFWAVQWHGSVYFKRGEASKQAEWDAANRAAQEKQEKLREAQRVELLEQSRKREAAEAAARDYEAKWTEARDAARRSKRPLVLAQCSGERARGGGEATPASTSSGPDGDGDAGVRLALTWEFVSLYDSAWTGATGQPVFGDPAGILAQAGRPDPASPSPYDVDRLVDLHRQNAERCSSDRRQLNALIDVVEKLRTQWDRVMR